MPDAPTNLLSKLYLISRIDGALAQIGVDKKRAEAELKEQQQKLSQKELERNTRQKILSERKTRHQREEKSLNEERHKLMDRRKALSSFSGQKIQQAAEREISATAEGLNNQEEALIQGLTEIEQLESEFGAADQALAQGREQLAKLQDDSQKTLVNLEERQRVNEAKRAELAGSIDRNALSTYNRVRERFPQNAVVTVKDKTCSGCFMTLVPQTMVQVARAETIIKCPGCGRILCLESQVTAENPQP